MGFPSTSMLATHLLLTPYAIGMAVLLIVIKKILDKEFDKAVVVGLLPLFHFFAFLAGIILMACYALWEKRARKPFVFASLLAIPQIAYYALTREAPAVYFKLGWLSPSQDLVSIAWFWVQNFGFYVLLGAIGWRFASKEVRRLFIAASPLFVLGNLFIFAPFAWDNVKLFLFFFIILAILSAITLGEIIKRTHALVVIALVLLATATGFLSIANITANSNITIYDSFDMKACQWASQNTPANALFLTDGQHTCMFGIIGRRVFLGDLEWITTHGLNYSKQLEENGRMLAGDCALMKENKIEFVYLGGYKPRHALVNETFLEQKTSVVYSQNGRTVYKVNC